MTAELYTKQFSFTGRPFTLLPDPDMLYWSAQHKRAFSVLEYGLVTHAPITVVTGEVGTGKTTLMQALLRTVENNTTVGLISNAQGGRGDLLRWVLNALGVEVSESHDYVTLFQTFSDFAVNEYAHGRHVVLIIDEAQNLGRELLEELRMLTNINSSQDTVLQLILLGQPELRDLIMDPSLSQFAQRVSASYHISPMDRKTTGTYITHRLQAVGGSGDEISDDAIDAIFSESGGVPRIINKICDLALVYAATDNCEAVTAHTVKELIADGIILSNRPLKLVLSPHMRTVGSGTD